MGTTTRQHNHTRRIRHRGTSKKTTPYGILSHTTPKHNTVGREATQHLLNLWRSGATLRESQQKFVWRWFDDYCISIFAKKFRKTTLKARNEVSNNPVKADAHTDRVVTCMNFFKDNRHKSIGWCMTAYRIRFHLFESQRYLADLGIKVKGVQSSENILYSHLLKIVRQNYTQLGTVSSEFLFWSYLSELEKPVQQGVLYDRISRQCNELAQALAVRYPVRSMDEGLQLYTTRMLGLPHNNKEVED